MSAAANVIKKWTTKKIVLWIVGILGSTGILFLLGSLLIVCIVCGIFVSSEQPDPSHSVLPRQVEEYRGIMTQYAGQYGIAEYVNLLLAVMAQESGGNGLDPMQSSECSYNTRYPKSPNSITDPLYSIECGVQALRDALNAASVTSPDDMDHIKLALQGYNFGGGYINWALEHYGGYTHENAKEFSRRKAAELGWTTYGDVDYVQHVLRYYTGGESGSALSPEQYNKLIAEASRYLGLPYVFGGSVPPNFDCSGFVCWVYTHSDTYNLPRTTAQGIYDQCTPVGNEDVKPGDLVFFTGTYESGTHVTHVGIYTGDNQMLHCSEPSIRYSDLDNAYWKNHFYAYGRLP